MSAVPWWLYLLAGGLIVGGLLAPFLLSGRASRREDTEVLLVARHAGVLFDGSHENRSDVDAATYGAELVELYALWPQAAMYDAEPTVPPIVPGRDTTP